jgi:glycosyltransferase involved in cell wall biosynthesis
MGFPMERIKVLVVSSVVPNAPGSGGELVLHRHLKLNSQVEAAVVSWERFPFRLKIIGKMRELGFRSLSRWMECLFPVLPSSKMVGDLVQSFRPDVILTVAHGWWHIQARRVATEFEVPLVSFFQDWWADFPDVPRAFRSRVEREFRQTCADSAVAICVSDGMRRALGEPENALVIHDVPSFTTFRSDRCDVTAPMRVAYFGNLGEYGPLIESALHVLRNSKRVRLEVFGSNPLWTAGTEEEFRSLGLYHGFLPTDQLEESLRQFQAVLVVMSFATEFRRRMTTSFPSKMINATQLGLPVIVWGPEYCSAVQWARVGDRALCVTGADSSALRHALEALADSPSDQERLANSAREAAAGEFNSERIEEEFISVLRRAIANRLSSRNPSG